MALPVQAQALPSDHAVTFASWLNVVLMGSRGAENDQSFELAERNITATLRKHPRGVGLFLLVMHDQRVADDYAAKVLGILKHFRPQILAAVAVIETKGFAGAAHRAVGQSVLTLSGMRGVIGLFGSLDDGGVFMSDRVFPNEQRSPGGVALRAIATRFRDQVHAEMQQGKSPPIGP